MSIEEDQLYNKSSNDCIVQQHDDDDVVSKNMSGGTYGRADGSHHTSDGITGQNIGVASNDDSINTSGRTHGNVDDVVINDSFPTLDLTYVHMANNNSLDTSDGHDGVLPNDSLLMDRLDELLQSEQISSTTTHGLHDCAGEEFVEDNMVLSSCVDDILFSSLTDVNEEMPQLIMDSWALDDDYNDINPSCINNAPLNFMQGDEEVSYLNMNMHPEEGPYSTMVSTAATTIDNNVVTSHENVMLNEDDEESMSQMFSDWLKCNSHAISLADMRKIKLKTSTIEDAMRRLGGGKKGLMLFVKCVLMWIQNVHMSSSSSSSSSNSSNNNNTSLGSMELPEEVPSNLISVLGGITTPFDELVQHDEINLQKPYCYNSDGINMSSHVMMPSRTVMTSSMSLSGDISSMTSPRDGCTATATSSSTSISTESVNNNPFLDKTWTNIQHEANDINDSPSWAPTNMFSSMMTNHMAPPASCQLGTTIPTFNNDDVATMMPQPGHGDVNATRAARKSRMERQRWSVRTSSRSRKLRSGSTLEAQCGRQRNHVRCRRRNHVLSSVYSDQYNLPTLAHGRHHGNLTSLCTQAIMEGKAVNLRPIAQSYVDSEHGQHKIDVGNKKLRLLFHKELKQSDVGSLGRIVLPKKYAETCLPYLEFRDGVNLAVEDFSSTKIWSMRYRFWPNNKSRMYLIENTGDFVKSYKLGEGDYMLLYFNLQSNRYVMLGAKGEIEELLCGGVPRDLCSSISSEQEFIDSHHDTSMIFGPCGDAVTNSEESCDDPLLAEFIEQSLEDFKDSSEDSVTVV